jgi:glycine/D-amino acid oxidase-like deaminating enzyme
VSFLNTKCDAVVIGAGVIGSAVAYELARKGLQVIVVDKAAGPGLGSTSSSSAVIRFNYSTYDGVALAWEAFQSWKNWRAHLAAPADETIAEVRNIGVMMVNVPVVSIPLTKELFTKVGIEHEVLDAAGMERIVPGIDTGKYWPPKKINDEAFWEEATQSVEAMYTPEGGYINDPLLAAVNLANAAQRHGVQFLFKKEVTEILQADGRVCGVELNDGEQIESPIVVNVAGPWSSHINELAGVGSDFTVSLRPMRQEVHHVPAPVKFDQNPIIGDLDVGVYIRPESGHAFLVGGTEPECDEFQWLDNPDDANMVRTQELFEAQVTRAARRLPDLTVPSSPSGVVGVYDVSSDWTPIYDKSELPGFYLACGSSGNQFKNAPTAGRIMAELITRVEAGHDHDSDPVIYTTEHTKQEINLGTFSRKRTINENSSGTVMG